MEFDHDHYMNLALELAFKAMGQDEIPVGALVVCDGEIVGEGFNNREQNQDPMGHAEVLALSAAAKKLKRWRLSGCTLYVTLEPCLMCAGAVILSRADRVVIGAKDPKAGAVTSLYQVLSDTRLNHRPDVIFGIQAHRCSDILKQFFSGLRN